MQQGLRAAQDTNTNTNTKTYKHKLNKNTDTDTDTNKNPQVQQGLPAAQDALRAELAKKAGISPLR